MTIQDRRKHSPNDPAATALLALQWVLADGDRANRFLDLTGLTPDGLRAGLGERATQRAVLEFLCAHEPDLLDASEALEIPPQSLVAAREALAMTRPLVITDCDEVLLHMVRHFRDWMEEAHGVVFSIHGDPFAQPMVLPGAAEPLSYDDKWRYLDVFFDDEMPRQTAIAGAVEAIAELQREADVVVLTNLKDRFQAARAGQLRDHGIDVPVFTNQGPKGPAIARILETYRPARAVFVDDLGHHHRSAAHTTPAIGRLHLCGEPAVAPHIECAHAAGHAHARIDSWAAALPWLQHRLHGERS